MLKIDPSERIDGSKLLDHPFLKKYRWKNAEVGVQSPNYEAKFLFHLVINQIYKTISGVQISC